MGSGIDAARAAGARSACTVMENFRDQLIIVLIKRLADKEGRLSIPVAETDDTGRDLLVFNVDPVTRCFNFEIRKKS